jgi:hypothetical protein
LVRQDRRHLFVTPCSCASTGNMGSNKFTLLVVKISIF